MPDTTTPTNPVTALPSAAPANPSARPDGAAPRSASSVSAPPAASAASARHERTAGHRNEVVVAGRVTAEPYVRELASGDRLTTWRVSIARAPAQQRPNQSADPITCVSFQQVIEEGTRDWRIGDTVQISGALRRRFWRSPKGAASVVEIEARAVQRISRCPGGADGAATPPHEAGGKAGR